VSFVCASGGRTRLSLTGSLVGLAAVAAMLAGGPGALPGVVASSAGTVSLAPATVSPGTTVTVTVVDPDLNALTARAGETTGAGGAAHELPAGASGTTHIFYVAHVPIGDMSGNDSVGPEDVEVSLADAIVANLSATSGLVTLLRTVDNGSAAPFSVTYGSDQVDSATVQVTSDADSTGFDLRLLETAAASGEFTATFVAGSETSTTNALSPSGTPRPVIEVADGGLVSAAYSDASPLRVMSDAVPVDGTAPTVIVEAPAYDAGLRTVTPWAMARVTDFGSGVGLDAIVFHVDLDRDGVFDETGERVSPSVQESEAISGGFVALALLPNMGEDGATEWYVTATDDAGNVGRSDADASEDGDQNHRVYVDTNAPSLLSATTGEAYDADEDEVLTGQRDTVRAVFSEELDPQSANANLFVVDGIRATEAAVFEEFPETVWLTVPGLPSRARLFEAVVGAVKDTAGHDSAPAQAWPADGVPALLDVSVDGVATRGPITVTVESDEELVVGPMITLNNVTIGRGGHVDLLRWQLVLDVGSLPGDVGEDGVKNAEVSAFDAVGNVGHGGVDSGAAAYPAGATLFELDRALARPVLTPAYGARVAVHNPVIAASYAGEAEEYEGDSLTTVSPVLATLNGEDVLDDLTTTDGSTWSLQTQSLGRGWHTFTIRAVDVAGNTHAPSVVRFYVDAEVPTPTPTPTATSTPTPETTPTAAPETTATPTPEPEGEPTATPAAAPTATPAPEDEPTAAPAPAATAAPPGGGGFTDREGASPEPTAAPTATPAPVPAPTVTGAETPEAAPTATPAAVRLPTPTVGASEGAEAATPTAVPEEEEAGGSETEADEVRDIEAEIEATVAALRAAALADEGAEEEIEVWEAGAGAKSVDFILYGAGLAGLLVAAGRRRMRGGPGQG